MFRQRQTNKAISYVLAVILNEPAVIHLPAERPPLLIHPLATTTPALA